MEAVSALERERATARLEEQVAKWFRWQGRLVVGKLGRLKKYFTESTTSDIDSMIDDALSVTVNDGKKFFSGGLLDGYTAGYADLENSLNLQKAFSLPHPEAVKWAEKHAAIDVADVNKATKKHIRNLIQYGLDEGESYSSVARSIKNQFEQFAVGSPLEHIASRAELVAVTEMGNAYEAGARTLIDEIQATGIDMEKRRGGPSDERTSDACLGDLDDGWIPADRAFSSGIMDGLEHPGCRHNTQYRVSREG